MRVLIMFLSLLGYSLFITGCSSTGEKFTAFDKADESFATVYFYRPSKLTLGARSLNVMQVDTTKDRGFDAIVRYWKLRNNSFVVDKLEPGSYDLTSNFLFKPTTFVFKSGEVYCVKLDVSPADLLIGNPDLKFVSKEICISEIAKTTQMTPEDKQNIFY